jgi:RNA polymerase sigma-70 factor (ECF subfamily)
MHIDADAKLVEDCRKGDTHAFERLIGKYEKPVFNAAFRMLGNRDDAADVTQTAFLKVFEKLDSYNPDYRFYSWLYRIAINESIDVLNQQKRTTELDESRMPDWETPERAIRQSELSATMQEALMTISTDYRTVIVLKHFMDCTYHEISRILEIPEKTVKSRLFTARQLLKDRLADTGLL